MDDIAIVGLSRNPAMPHVTLAARRVSHIGDGGCRSRVASDGSLETQAKDGTMPTERTDKILELVVFTLKDGVTRDQLLGTVDAVSDWAKGQPGFLSRDLSYAPAEHRWIEVVWWRSLADAEAAAEAALSSPSCAPMFALIDMESAQMLHGVPAIAPVTH